MDTQCERVQRRGLMSAAAVLTLLTTAISPAPRTAGAGATGSAECAAGQQGGSRRDDVKIMEVVLTNAVKNGADTLARQMQIQEPGSIIVTGTARARGFVLDGYGVFFIVDVPMMKQSVVWSNQVLLREQRRDFLRQSHREHSRQSLAALCGADAQKPGRPPGHAAAGISGHAVSGGLTAARRICGSSVSSRRPSSRRLQGWPARRTFPIRSPALRRCGIRTSCTPRP